MPHRAKAKLVGWDCGTESPVCVGWTTRPNRVPFWGSILKSSVAT